MESTRDWFALPFTMGMSELMSMPSCGTPKKAIPDTACMSFLSRSSFDFDPDMMVYLLVRI
jgi:hypothetical protein